MASPKCCACHDFASPEPRARQHPSPLDSCQMLPLPRKHTLRCTECCACHDFGNGISKVLRPPRFREPRAARATTSQPFRQLPNAAPAHKHTLRCRYRLGTASNFVVYMSEADNVYDPLYGSFVGDQGAWSTAKMYFTVPPNGVAKLHFGAHFQAPGLPNQTEGTVDVYGLSTEGPTMSRWPPWARCCWSPRSPR